MNDWQEFKKSFTQKQEDAIWQYLIDHSRIQKNGYYGIQFYVRDMDDLWRRLFARYTGDFQRYDKLEKEHNQQLQSYWFQKRLTEKNDKIVRKIIDSGSWIERLRFTLYKKLKKQIFYT